MLKAMPPEAGSSCTAQRRRADSAREDICVDVASRAGRSSSRRRWVLDLNVTKRFRSGF